MQRMGSRAVIFTVLAIYAMVNLLSFVWVGAMSFKSSAEIMSTSPWSPPEAINWKNYSDAWTVGRIGGYMLNSLLVTSVSTVVALAISSMSGYILGKFRFRGRGIVMGIFMVAMMIPPFMIVVPLFDVLQSLRLLDSHWGLILVYIAMQVPLNTFILTAFHRTLPKQLEEAAAIDGASPLRTFAQIVLPLTAPALIACGIVNVLHIWNEFLYALVFLQDRTKYTLPVGIFNLGQVADYSSNWGILFAGMFVSILPVLILFAVFQKQFTSGIAQGAIKM
ncbi:MAG TPA: carbohydrate ABC transporter permease [Candidatus Avipropionibacterium avicola]|uniref:Carbohydrate ABC transporter permease n=1 Tax=Candidatus Avipropionibacterium avicola TaxID=2840701 RepID=A0A9D1GX75_9ACTN|nr:carbohydrate ABC transporter permease [Candidatus Avipropionibacterium avicola]